MIKIIKKFVYEGEFLEFDLKEQIRKHKKEKLIFFHVLIKKIFRNLYRSFQRFLIKPSIRNKFALSEIKLIRFFSKNKKDNYDSFELNDIKILKNSSCLELPDLLSFDQIERIKKYLEDQKKLNIIEKSTNKIMPMDYYSTEDLIKNHEILNVVNNERLIKIVKGYFNCNFKLDWIWSWWSYASDTNKSIGPQLFHRDYESLNFLKLFIYLTDVKNNDGSHQIIKNSHEINLSYKISRFSDEEINSKFNKKEFFIIDGKAGKSFLANTYAIHRGLHPNKNDRLVLCYLLSTWPSRRSPKIPPVNFSEIQNNKESYLRNKSIYDLFINFEK